MKYQSELINEILERRGHEKSSLHYESECVEEWIEEYKGAYPKLCDYKGEWLNYIVENPIGMFPYETITDVSEATVNNVVPFAYKSAILKGCTGYRDIDTGEILETFEEGRNLELVSVKMPVLKTFNNIVDFSNEKLEFEYGVYLGQKSDGSDWVNIKGVPSSFVYTLNYINILDSKDKMTFYGNDTIIDRVVWFDENKKQLDSIANINNRTLNIPTNAKYFRFLLNDSRFAEDKELAKDNIEHYNIYYGGVSQIFNNEPHKSNILTVNEDVTLRSNGSVCDELDLLTGKLTQRIDEDGEILAQEVVKTVDLNITNQDGQTLSRIKPIEGTMHVQTNGQPIKPLLEMVVPVEATTQNLASFTEER